MLPFPPQVSSEHQTTWLTPSTAQLRPQEEEVKEGCVQRRTEQQPQERSTFFNGFLSFSRDVYQTIHFPSEKVASPKHCSF